MKDKIVAAKERVKQHKTAISFGSGVAVGAGAVVIAIIRKEPPHTVLTASSEMLQKLIEHPQGAMHWTHKYGATITVLNDLNDELQ